ncbi:MAG TPA: TIGR01457 family HAD-type hydrolase [Chloroflexota bacterium]
MNGSMTLRLADIRHLLIDLDGVVYVGSTPLPGARELVAWLRDRGITFRLVSNNATLTPHQYIQKLSAMGIEVAEEEVFTSALATALYLHKQRGIQTAYVIGEDGLLEALASAGVIREEEHPDWVVVGLDRRLTYEKLVAASLAIRAGARFVGTNPDRSLPTERGLVPGAGAILAALQTATGVNPMIIGKPEPLMLELATAQLGGTVSDTAMLGDRLDTDIEGGRAAGLRTILVLTGVSTRDDLANSSVQPSLVVNNLEELMRSWALEGAQHE